MCNSMHIEPHFFQGWRCMIFRDSPVITRSTRQNNISKRRSSKVLAVNKPQRKNLLNKFNTSRFHFVEKRKKSDAFVLSRAPNFIRLGWWMNENKTDRKANNVVCSKKKLTMRETSDYSHPPRRPPSNLQLSLSPLSSELISSPILGARGRYQLLPLRKYLIFKYVPCNVSLLFSLHPARFKGL